MTIVGGLPPPGCETACVAFLSSDPPFFLYDLPGRVLVLPQSQLLHQLQHGFVSAPLLYHQNNGHIILFRKNPIEIQKTLIQPGKRPEHRVFAAKCPILQTNPLQASQYLKQTSVPE
ncbi:MAG: hypothetical protein SO137_08215, partial [Gemmiger sp.]|uniref:hypothetical protein n=1 Tax=Gemmiger sp. TaxID=2049027 RepID=UPI002A80F4CF